MNHSLLGGGAPREAQCSPKGGITASWGDNHSVPLGGGILRNREQFVGKLDDALAISKRNWAHFADSRGAPPATLLRLPRELGALVSARRASDGREVHAEDKAQQSDEALRSHAKTTTCRGQAPQP